MNDTQLLRYSRNIFLPEIDIKGQEKLLASRVLIIGLGGLGSPVAMYLAASGVGCLMLADKETVDLSNLQRQILHTTADVDHTLKTHSAHKTLTALNPDVKLELIDDLTQDNLLAYVKQVDCVVDCTDNFATRFAVNRACVSARVPLVSGSAIKFSGQLCVFDFRQHISPCYQCLFQDEKEGSELRCQDQGVIAPLVGIIGSMQALEVIKLLLDLPVDTHRLLQIDALTMKLNSSRLGADPECVVCRR